MRQAFLRWTVSLGMVVSGGAAAFAQVPGSTQSPPQNPSQNGTVVSPPATDAQVPSAAPVAGGKLHGAVKSGTTPLPGVTITAQNTLTGKKYSTTTDINGAWSMSIPQNGRYVVKTQFAAFAASSQEAVLNATNHDQTVTFALLLASRAIQQQQQQDAAESQQTAQAAIRQLVGNGAQSLSLISAMTGDTETQTGTAGASGAALPSAAGNSDFSGDSVAVSGASGQVSPLAGVDMDRIRDAIETARVQGAFSGGQGGGIFSGALGGGGGFGGGGFGGGGFGGGGFGGGGFGGGGGGRGGNFRGFNPGQPHGAIFWMGSNSALNAEPFALNGQQQEQPAAGTNRFGITFMSAPYIPHLTKPSGKDTVFLTLSG